MKNNIESVIINAIGRFSLKLDHIEKGLAKVNKNTLELNVRFNRLFELFQDILDLKNRAERLEKAEFKN